MAKRSKATRAAQAAAAAERAAAYHREQQRRQRTRRMILVGAVVAAIAVVIGAGFVVQSLRDTTGEQATPPAGAVDSYSLAVGQPDAPVEVVVYEDFLCPACGIFESETSEELARLAADGEIYVRYRPFNFLTSFGDYSERSTNAFAVVLDTSGPQVAKKFHDLLYADQPPESGPLPDDDWLVEKAVEAGAREAAVRGPIEDLAFEQWVQNASDAASQDGVESTPHAVVDGEVIDGDSMEDFVANFEDALG